MGGCPHDHKDADMEKAMLSCGITTKVLMKWGVAIYIKKYKGVECHSPGSFHVCDFQVLLCISEHMLPDINSNFTTLSVIIHTFSVFNNPTKH